MPDDNVTTPNPASAAAPTLPTVAVSDATVPDVAMPAAPAPEAPSAPVSDVVVTPDVPAEPRTAAPAAATNAKVAGSDAEIRAEVAKKIGEAHNVLVALSSDPSVDEMAAAIGLSLYLDKLGKRATAIYSGQTPNALEFLKPEETFEDSVDTLQDFVIALNKEKADHLRYKLDGEYVKIYITPYKSKISEEDLEFSYGDYNVDLVLALDVANGVDLDAALREHGRIMHDAVIIDITTGNPGKLGEIEWSDKSASSVSEMIARLLYSVKSDVKIGKEEATAFLTGIVAATNRFSNAGTTPETMRTSSRLMESGANQQLVSKNITADIDNEMVGMMKMGVALNSDEDPTKLDIKHGNEGETDGTKTVSGAVTEKESTLLDDLKAAEESLAGAGAETTPEADKEPLKIEDTGDANDLSGAADAVAKETTEMANAMSAADDAAKKETTEATGATGAAEATGMAETPEVTSETPVAENEAPTNENGVTNDTEDFISDKPEKVLQPTNGFGIGGTTMDDTNKYGHMLEDALADAGGMSQPEVAVGQPNPAATGAPAVATNPEINGVPEINYMPMPGDEVLPPPPAPPIDMNGAAPAVEPAAAAMEPAATPAVEPVMPAVEPIAPAAPAAEPTPAPLGAQPAMQDQVYSAPANDPSAFKIPGA